MPRIPIQVGDRSALVDIPGKPKCAVPGCHGDHWTSCDYPVRRDGKQATCDIKLCEEHAKGCKEPNTTICPAHCRLIARGVR